MSVKSQFAEQTMNHCLLPGHYCIQGKKSKIRSSRYLLPFDLLIYTTSPFYYELVTNILPPLDNGCFKSKEHKRWIFKKKNKVIITTTPRD